ncbi:hypothetical protein [Frankia sp. Cas4]|uniref:hypothetical protein n=1 Tax=Frankia sp. Cas4 TaxID=3073927 RepID=UPI002AD2E83B|nr:hypothetical protein [Frankia sp. Cas4]
MTPLTSLAFTPVTAADLGLPAPQAIAAAWPLFVVGLLMWRRWLPRVTACFALVAGTALTSGWLHDGIVLVLGWVTWAINEVTRSTAGGIAPGALAIILLIYFVAELRPDPGAVGKLAQLRETPRALVAAGTATGTRRPGRYGAGGKRASRGRPQKLAAASVGLLLPAVALTIPGTGGAVVTSAVNVIGGAFAWPITALFGTGT